MDTKIIIKIRKEDKQRFQDSAKALALTLSGYMKLCASEKSNKMLTEAPD